MKATINGVHVEGRPEEIQSLISALRPPTKETGPVTEGDTQPRKIPGPVPSIIGKQEAQRLVYEAFRAKNKPARRVEIVNMTGLSQSEVQTSINRLFASGMIERDLRTGWFYAPGSEPLAEEGVLPSATTPTGRRRKITPLLYRTYSRIRHLDRVTLAEVMRLDGTYESTARYRMKRLVELGYSEYGDLSNTYIPIDRTDEEQEV